MPPPLAIPRRCCAPSTPPRKPLPRLSGWWRLARWRHGWRSWKPPPLLPLDSAGLPDVPAVRSLRSRVFRLHDELPSRWRAAWVSFWERVVAIDPEAAEAEDAFYRGLAADDLDAWSKGILPAILADVDALADEWRADLDALVGPDPQGEAWERWLCDVYDRIPRDSEAPDLTLWPHSFRPPPVDPPERTAGERAFFRARLADGNPASMLVASLHLGILAIAEALTPDPCLGPARASMPSPAASLPGLHSRRTPLRSVPG